MNLRIPAIPEVPFLEFNPHFTMKTFRSSQGRGRADFGWLKSRHSFSFGDYYDPTNMGWGPLRVLNDDWIDPGHGFPMHPHRDMEIFSYVTHGALTHEDSMGSRATLQPGRIQFMRAGSGVRHSEFNPSADEATHLLQIWIEPDTQGLPPAYAELDIDWDSHPNQWIPLLAPVHAPLDTALTLHQDASVWVARLSAGASLEVHSLKGRKGYLHLIDGQLSAENVQMGAGDALAIEDESAFNITASVDAELLFFDLPH